MAETLEKVSSLLKTLYWPAYNTNLCENIIFGISWNGAKFKIFAVESVLFFNNNFMDG